MILELQNVSKKFGEKKVISNVSFSIEQGAIFGFLGPNGAGKTTTIRLVAGILAPTEGKINVCGYDLVSEPLSAKKLTGYIPDSPYLYQKLKGIEYLELIADIYEVENFNVRAFELAERFELKKVLNNFIESYSFGMKQKLSIVGAVLPSPKLIVVDEPLIGLDPPAARTVKDLFIELKNSGCAVFMSTHLLEIAELLCDRVGIIDNGAMIIEGKLSDIKAKYDSRLEEIFLRMLAERRVDEERRRWEALADAASR